LSGIIYDLPSGTLLVQVGGTLLVISDKAPLIVVALRFYLIFPFVKRRRADLMLFA
jgi:hypothetical protein